MMADVCVLGSQAVSAGDESIDKCQLTLLQKSGISYPQPRAPFLNRIRFLNRILQWKEAGLPGGKMPGSRDGAGKNPR